MLVAGTDVRENKLGKVYPVRWLPESTPLNNLQIADVVLKELFQ